MGRDDVIQSVSVVRAGISREFDDEDGGGGCVSWVARLASRCIRLVIELKCVTHAHTHTDSRCENDE